MVCDPPALPARSPAPGPVLRTVRSSDVRVLISADLRVSAHPSLGRGSSPETMACSMGSTYHGLGVMF